MLSSVIRAYLPEIEQYSLRPIGSGLIHHTWKVEGPDGKEYVLQEVNTAVFSDPAAIAENLDKIGRYLAREAPDYLFPLPVRTAEGAVFYRDEVGKYYRMFPFVSASKTYDVVSSPEQAFEASRQFGQFTRRLRSFDVGQLRETLPHFHDLALRYEQFDRAVFDCADSARLRESRKLIEYLIGRRELVDVYVRL